jgi:hypothetical protein
MSAKLRWYAASIAAAAVILLTTPSQAAHDLPVVGGSGDAAGRAICPPGQTLAGFAGRAGVWVDQIQMVCAAPDRQPVATGPRYGGRGGGATDGFCPRNWDMTHARLNMTTGNRQVAAIQFECRSRATGETTNMSFGNSTYRGRCPGVGVGNCPIDPAVAQTCPADEVPLGFNVRYGKDVNAIGLICGRPAANGTSTSTQAETDVDRPGNDYKHFDLEPTIAGFAPCKSGCESDASCKAWTWVKAGVQGPKARCWLKSAVPPAKPNGCCVSGVKTGN